MSVRFASNSDIPAIIELLSQVLDYHHQLRPDLFQAEGGKYSPQILEAILANPDQPVFVYTDDRGQILGHIFLQIKTEVSPVKKPVKTLYIDDLCVAQKNRSSGIGQKLYNRAKSLAKKEGCYNLTLNVWEANQGAVRFYEKLGFTTQQRQMELILNDESDSL